MKKLLSILILVLTASMLSAQSELKASDIFSQNNDAVVFINQALMFNDENIKHPDLFTLMEDTLEADFRNAYLPLGSGTGFFISNDGYLITNNHVVEKSNIADIKRAAAKGIENDLRKIFEHLDFSWQEENKIIADFKSMINGATFSYQVRLSDDSEYDGKVVFTDADVDLALMKIESSTYNNYIVFDDNDALAVGEDVVAIGYPMQSSIATFLEDFQPTLSTGIVSAIRTDNWGVQHTASINPGNSGGPLFNTMGKLVGVNVGGMPSANDIYFSIPLAKLIRFLEDNGEEDMVQRNISGLKLTATGQIVEQGPYTVGSTFLLKGDRSISITIDGEKRGNLPQLIENLSEGEHEILFETADKYHKRTFNIDTSIAAVKEYKPYMQFYTGNLYIDVANAEGEVYVNDRSYGDAPCIISGLPSGEHTVTIKSTTHSNFTETVTVVRDETSTFSFELLEKQLLSFDSELLEGTVILLTSENGDEQEYAIGDEIKVDNGVWTVCLKNEGYNGRALEVTVEKADAVVAVSDYLVNNVSFIQTLDSDAVISFSNEEETFSFAKDDLMFINDGTWFVSVSGTYYNDESVEITVDGEAVEIDLESLQTGYPVVFENIRSSSKVYINQEDVTQQLNEKQLLLKSGTYDIAIYTPNYQPYFETVTIAMDSFPEVSISYTLLGGAQRTNGMIASGLVTAAGVGAAVYGLIVFDDTNAINNSADYAGYVEQKYMGQIFIGAGAGVALTGGVLFIMNLIADVPDETDGLSEPAVVDVSFENGIFLDFNF